MCKAKLLRAYGLAQDIADEVVVLTRPTFRGSYKKCTEKFLLYAEPKTIKVGKRTLRLLPEYKDYGFARNGEVILLSDGSRVSKSVTPGAYIRIHLTDSYNVNKSRPLHRLVAYAWVDNDDWVNKPIVNHKNGHKHICRSSNLEWCDTAHNIAHAVATGLIPTNACVIRDIVTGKEKEFPSTEQACEHIGALGTNVAQHLKHGLKYPIKGRYEIKLKGDTSPWKFNKGGVKHSKEYSRYHFAHEDKVYDFGTVRELYDHFKIPYVTVQTAATVIPQIKRLHGVTVTVVRIRDNASPCETRVESTSEVMLFTSITKAAKHHGIPHDAAHKAFNKGNGYMYRGVSFRAPSDEPWVENPKALDRQPTEIIVITSSGVTIYSSIRDCSRKADINTSRVRRALRGNGVSGDTAFFKPGNDKDTNVAEIAKLKAML